VFETAECEVNVRCKYGDNFTYLRIQLNWIAVVLCCVVLKGLHSFTKGCETL